MPAARSSVHPGRDDWPARPPVSRRSSLEGLGRLVHSRNRSAVAALAFGREVASVARPLAAAPIVESALPTKTDSTPCTHGTLCRLWMNSLSSGVDLCASD